MHLPTLIDTTFSVITVILVLSLMASAIYEFIEKYTRQRSELLYKAIQKALYDPSLKANYAELLYRHPVVKTLFEKTDQRPSYIDPAIFSEALVDVVVQEYETEQLTYNREEGVYELPDDVMKMDKREKFSQAVAQFSYGEFGTFLRTFQDSSTSLDQMLSKITNWYERYMDRVGGWYKRKSQNGLFIVGLVLAIGLNIDLITVTDTIYKNSEIRENIATIGEGINDAGIAALNMSESSKKELRKVVENNYKNLQNSGLPIGWSAEALQPFQEDFQTVVKILLGWSLMAFAISRGAPFWFGILSKLINIRSTGSKNSRSND